jgi:hypothetical protein
METTGFGVSLHFVALALAFPPLAGTLATIRAVLARGLARWLAVLAMVMAAVPLYAMVFGQTAEDPALRYLTWLGERARTAGWLIWLIPISVPLALSGLVPGVRARGVDVLHGLAVAAIAGLWWAGL